MGLELALLALATGGSIYNTRRTEKKQDKALAQSIRNQSKKQQQMDARINDEVSKLESSTAEGYRQKNLASYVDALRKRSGDATAGLAPGFGSEVFQMDAGKAAEGVAQYGQDNAALMARIDAPGDQRRAEGKSQGFLGTDLDMLGREARGQEYLDKLRYDKIRRNPWIDALSQVAMGAAGGTGGGVAKFAGGSGRTGSSGGFFSGMLGVPSAGMKKVIGGLPAY